MPKRRPAANEPVGRAPSGRAVGPSCSGFAPLSRIEPVLSPISRIAATSSGPKHAVARKAGELAALVLDRARVGAGLLDQRRHDAGHRRVREVPGAGELERRQPGALARADVAASSLLKARLDPAVRPEAAMVVLAHRGVGPQVAPEEPAVVDDTGDHAAPRCAAAASSTSSPGHGSSGLRIIIAQSIRSPKRSRQLIRSSVKPLAGPGATPIAPSGRHREAPPSRPRPPRDS